MNRNFPDIVINGNKVHVVTANGRHWIRNNLVDRHTRLPMDRALFRVSDDKVGPLATCAKDDGLVVRQNSA